MDFFDSRRIRLIAQFLAVFLLFSLSGYSAQDPAAETEAEEQTDPVLEALQRQVALANAKADLADARMREATADRDRLASPFPTVTTPGGSTTGENLTSEVGPEKGQKSLASL